MHVRRTARCWFSLVVLAVVVSAGCGADADGGSPTSPLASDLDAPTPSPTPNVPSPSPTSNVSPSPAASASPTSEVPTPSPAATALPEASSTPTSLPTAPPSADPVRVIVTVDGVDVDSAASAFDDRFGTDISVEQLLPATAQLIVVISADVRPLLDELDFVVGTQDDSTDPPSG